MSENFKVSKELIRHSILYDFRAGLKAAESHHRLCQAFGQDVVSHQKSLIGTIDLDLETTASRMRAGQDVLSWIMKNCGN